MRRITYVLSLILIFMLPWEDSVSIPGWGSLVRILGFVVVALWFATVLVEGRFRRPHVFHLLVLLFLVWNLASVFWSRDIGKTLNRLLTYGQTFLLLLVLWEVFRTAGELTISLQAYIFGACVLVIGTIYDYANGIVAVAYEGRYSAPGINANDCALMLMLGLPLAMHLLLTSSPPGTSFVLRLVNLAYVPLAIFSAILTGSRTSLLAIIPFAIYLLALRQIRLQQKALILAILLVGLLLLLPFVPETVISRLGTLGTSISAGDIGGRVELWQESIGLLEDQPLLGIGSGTLPSAIGGAAHDTFVSIATETGFIGLTLFLFILGLVIYQAFRLPRGESGLWLAVLFTWVIGVLTLSWEFRKLTWIFPLFVIIAGSAVPHRDGAKDAVQIPEGPTYGPDLSTPQIGSEAT